MIDFLISKCKSNDVNIFKILDAK